MGLIRHYGTFIDLSSFEKMFIEVVDHCFTSLFIFINGADIIQEFVITLIHTKNGTEISNPPTNERKTLTRRGGKKGTPKFMARPFFPLNFFKIYISLCVYVYIYMYKYFVIWLFFIILITGTAGDLFLWAGSSGLLWHQLQSLIPARLPFSLVRTLVSVQHAKTTLSESYKCIRILI